MRLWIVLLLIPFFSAKLAAQNNASGNYMEAVADFNKLNAQNELSGLALKFEKIAQSNVNDWLPSYYTSILYARLSLKQKQNADLNADIAIYWANKSISIQTNDENYCALSMAKTAKMAVNPYLRWMSYEKSIYEPLAKARKINVNNPRIYILEASLKLNLPVLFGGGCEKSKPILNKAKQLLNKQLPQPLLPTWGKQSLDEMKQSCPF
jgi:hypothetical protein